MAEALADISLAVEQGNTQGLLSGQREFVEAGLAALDNYYLSSVLRGLIPAGLRLGHLVACHGDFDPRDTLRYHQALFAAIKQGERARVGQMVSAFGRREGRLANGSLAQRHTDGVSMGLSRPDQVD
jgi:DNA-binding GntR family transcriptional regulator